MANITVSNRTTDTIYDIGAIICRTPKTLDNTVENGIERDNRCVLITSVSQLIDYFGDPFIDPNEYTDLIIAYRLVRSGYPIYISSLYEMQDNDDGFVTRYNGYTEFYFTDKYKHKTVGYKLKSNIKFCQPIIQSNYNQGSSELTLYVSLYLLERDIRREISDINKINSKRLYKTYSIRFDASNLKDADVIDALKSIGIELVVLNSYSDDSLISEFKRFTSFKIILSDLNNNNYYTVDFHSDDYNYNFSDDNSIHNAYKDAIDRLSLATIQPSLLCMGKLYKSNSLVEDGHVLRSYMEDLDCYNYSVIYNYLLQSFDDESDTYLFINAPDVSVSSAIDFFSLSGTYKYALEIPSQYNCDAFYGYANDLVSNSLYYQSSARVYYSAAILSFYNYIIKQETFLSNSIGDLNISCDSVKSVIPEDASSSLLAARCNSIVTFDKGYPSIYGDRSLSTSSNLKYSHIAHSFVYIRRLIRTYIETIKFSLNTDYELQLASSHIRFYILQRFVDSGVLASFTVSYQSVSAKSVEFNIELQFNGVIETINLNFTI